jgi:hypothetical protein
MTARIIPFPSRRPRREPQIEIVRERNSHDARRWMLASELFAMRLGELDHAGGCALFAALAREPFVDAEAVLRVVGGST